MVKLEPPENFCASLVWLLLEMSSCTRSSKCQSSCWTAALSPFWCVKHLSCCSGTRKEGAYCGTASILFSTFLPLIPAVAGMNSTEVLPVDGSLLWGTV